MKTYRVIVFLVVLTFILTACGGAAEPVQTPLRVGWITWGGFYPLVIGYEKGFFKQNGVDLELVHFDIYNQGFPAIDSGGLDGFTMSLGDAAVLEGFTPESIRFVLISNVAMDAEGIVASPEVATADDLRGKSIGCNLGTYGELFVRRVLAENNIAIGEVHLVNIPPEGITDAISRGKIQAGHTWEPSLTDAIRGGNHILYRASDLPGLITDGVAFRSSVVEKYPEAMRGFVAAWFEALAWWQANPQEAARIVAQYTGLSTEEISTEGINLFDLNENLAAFQPGQDTSSIFFTAGLYRDFLAETGVVSAEVDVEILLDPSFLK